MSSSNDEIKKEQAKLKEQNERQRVFADQLKAKFNASEQMTNLRMEKVKEHTKKAEKLDEKAATIMEKNIKSADYSSFVEFQTTIMACAQYLEVWTEARNHRYYASLYEDPETGAMLINAEEAGRNLGDVVKKLPRKAKDIIGSMMDTRLDTLKEKFKGEQPKDSPMLPFRFEYGDGSFSVNADVNALPEGLLDEYRQSGHIADAVHAMQDGLTRDMDNYLHTKGYEKDADGKYHKDGEPLTEERFNHLLTTFRQERNNELQHTNDDFEERSGLRPGL